VESVPGAKPNPIWQRVLMSELLVTPSPVSWLWNVKFPWEDSERFLALKSLVKVPGSRWQKGSKSWLVPQEVVEMIEPIAQKMDYRIKWEDPDEPILRHLSDKYDKLYPLQQEGVDEALCQDAAWLFNDEMGCGKSPQVIEVLKARGAKSILVVVPAMGRRVWWNPKRPETSHLGKWWQNHPEVKLIESGEQAAAGNWYGISVCSYRLLGKLARPAYLDAIIFDEAHYLMSKDSQQSMEAGLWTKQFPKAFRLLMTGTLITTRPDSMWHPLDIAWPKRFGSYYEFRGHYMQERLNDAGYPVWDTPNPAKIYELEQRIKRVSSRITKSDLAGLLPPFSVQLQPVDNHMVAAKQWIEDHLAQGAKHLILFTYWRKSAENLAKSISMHTAGKNAPEVVQFHGGQTPVRRHNLVDHAKSCERSVIICTIDSTKEVIDLTHARNVLYAEILGNPATMAQSLGRLNRLSSQENTDITVFTRGEDDVIALSLAERIVTHSKIIRAGSNEEALKGVLGELTAEGMPEQKAQEMISEIMDTIGDY